MLIKYYKDENLAYSNRKRYRTFNSIPIYEEEQSSILLGDGAQTQIKTTVSNICDYVTIDDTRWFVTSYVYMNGGQVTLNLQRDVIGEFGVNSFYGKIERGYTDTFLRNRKELGLNQILKDRKPLKQVGLNRGNYTISSSENEMWGILYFINNSEFDIETGNPKSYIAKVGIPGFSPNISNLSVPLKNYTTYIENNPSIQQSVSFIVNITKRGFANSSYDCQFTIGYNNSSNSYETYVNRDYTGGTTNGNKRKFYKLVDANVDINNYTNNLVSIFNSKAREILPMYNINNKVGQIDEDNSKYTYELGNVGQIKSYNGKYVRENYEGVENIYQYSVSNTTKGFWGQNNLSPIKQVLVDYSFIETNNSSYIVTNTAFFNYNIARVNKTIVKDSDASVISINLEKTLIDEPFVAMAVPLFDTVISGQDINENTGVSENVDYNIVKGEAFNVFNTIIQYLSGGSNPYIIDAQIYPYCPFITSCASKVKVSKNPDRYIPFFNISSNSYETECELNLFPFSDIKKEYICREYNITSPDKTGRFTFNFYDYVLENIPLDGDNSKNSATIKFTIKTALKPLSIISSVIIERKGDVLAGITFPSDLNGCSPSSSGFECSLSSNAFQTYKRENSNYQQIFNKQQEQLQIQHQVERVNEKASVTLNTLTATMMGAIGGASLGGKTTIGKMIGGLSGAALAGGVVGSAMNYQLNENDRLRMYEERLQSEMFDLEIGTIKNLPNSVSRVSSFNEIIMQEFYFTVDTYECSDAEISIVNDYITNFSYSLGITDYYNKYLKNGWFIKGNLLKSSLPVNLHSIASNEVHGGVYIYD